MEAWSEEQLTRRERLRVEREATHSAPARIRLKFTGVLVIILALLTWLGFSWLNNTVPGTAEVPQPPTLENQTDDDAGSSSAGESNPVGTDGVDPDVPTGGEGGTASSADDVADGAGAAGAGSSEVGDSPVVHVGGAVKDPGVVELPPGSRVHEAIEAAGGMTAEAEPGGLNLAAPIQDGTMIWVPTPDEVKNGDALPGELANPGGTPDQGEGVPSGAGPSELINLNTADAATLDELPGIGPALSERIITHRETQGPFTSLEELAAVSGIGPVILENVEGLVTW